MRLVGLGVDLHHAARMQRIVREGRAGRLAQRILASSEHTQFDQLAGDAARARFLAVRWCIKEAAYKALSPRRVSFRDMAVTGGPKPALQCGDGSFLLSVSHDGDYVLASVLAYEE